MQHSVFRYSKNTLELRIQWMTFCPGDPSRCIHTQLGYCILLVMQCNIFSKFATLFCALPGYIFIFDQWERKSVHVETTQIAWIVAAGLFRGIAFCYIACKITNHVQLCIYDHRLASLGSLDYCRVSCPCFLSLLSFDRRMQSAAHPLKHYFELIRLRVKSALKMTRVHPKRHIAGSTEQCCRVASCRN